MNKAEFSRFHMEICDRAHSLMTRKNHDYSYTKTETQGEEQETDAFKNFRLSEAVAGISADRGAFIRLLDKVSRMGTLLQAEAAVGDEKFEDTAVDLINYTIIVMALLRERKSSESRTI